jgi:hypothetical protein
MQLPPIDNVGSGSPCPKVVFPPQDRLRSYISLSEWLVLEQYRADFSDLPDCAHAPLAIGIQVKESHQSSPLLDAGRFAQPTGSDGDVEAPRSEGAQELDQVVLLLVGQFRAEHQVEELDRIVECQEAPIVQVGR